MSVRVPAALRRKIRAHFANCCAYCLSAESLTVAIYEVEHIIPISAAGATSFENLCLACPTCNRYKADRTIVTDPETQTKVPLFHPHRDLWSDHFEWISGGTEIAALSPTGRATVDALRMNRQQLIRVRRMWVAMNEHPPKLL